MRRHFLVEARKAGYPVADRVYTEMLIGLRAQAKLSTVQNPELAELSLAAYACYVLAAAGYPEKGAMHYLKDRGVSGLSDYSHFQLAGAFALSGGLETALSMLPVSVSPQTFKRRDRWDAELPGPGASHHAGCSGRSKRAASGYSDARAESRRDCGDERRQVGDDTGERLRLPRARQNHAETAGARLHGYRHAQWRNISLILTRWRNVTPGLAWDGAQVWLSVEGNGSCYYYWSAFGIPRDSFIEEYSRELQVRRRYFE